MAIDAFVSFVFQAYFVYRRFVEPSTYECIVKADVFKPCERYGQGG